MHVYIYSFLVNLIIYLQVVLMIRVDEETHFIIFHLLF